jgi:hypothetical protein
MEIITHLTPFHYIEIKNLYTKEEKKEMLIEMMYLGKNNKLRSPEETGSASNDGVFLKQNKGVFIDEVYSDRRFSDILRLNRRPLHILFGKTHNTPEPTTLTDSWIFNNIELNSDTTLLSYYEDGDYYEAHRDTAMVTIIDWNYLEPKNFTGGDLIFPYYDNHTIKVSLTSTYVFISNIAHYVSPIKIIDKGIKQSGRFSLACFGQPQ